MKPPMNADARRFLSHRSACIGGSLPRRYEVALQKLGGGVHVRRHGHEPLADDDHAFPRLLPLLLLERLSNKRHRFDSIARVETRSIELMFEPGPARQPFRSCQQPLALKKQFVQRTKLRRIALEKGA